MNNAQLMDFMQGNQAGLGQLQQGPIALEEARLLVQPIPLQLRSGIAGDQFDGLAVHMQVRHRHCMGRATLGQQGQQHMLMLGPGEPGLSLLGHIALPGFAVEDVGDLALWPGFLPDADPLVGRHLLLMNQSGGGAHEVSLGQGW